MYFKAFRFNFTYLYCRNSEPVALYYPNAKSRFSTDFTGSIESSASMTNGYQRQVTRMSRYTHTIRKAVKSSRKKSSRNNGKRKRVIVDETSEIRDELLNHIKKKSKALLLHPMKFVCDKLTITVLKFFFKNRITRKLYF